MITLEEELENSMRNFEENILENLKKNGFPQNAVAFPLDAVFEAASKKGFSFNKVRDRLLDQSISVVLEDSRVVFSKLQDNNESYDDLTSGLLSKISPDQMKRFQEMIGGIDPEQLASIKALLDSMSEGEKIDLMKKMEGFL